MGQADHLIHESVRVSSTRKTQMPRDLLTIIYLANHILISFSYFTVCRSRSRSSPPSSPPPPGLGPVHSSTKEVVTGI